MGKQRGSTDNGEANEPWVVTKIVVSMKEERNIMYVKYTNKRQHFQSSFVK